MKSTTLEIPERVEFVTDKHAMQLVRLRTGPSTVSLYLQGAHITSYRMGERELLWMSETSSFESGKAIRGGIPVCWPWFGVYDAEGSRPQHGFARTSMFQVVSTSASDTESRVLMRLAQSSPFPDWPPTIGLEFEVRLGDALWMELRTSNGSDRAVECGAALHTYFAVTAAGDVAIPEVQGLRFKDKTRDFLLDKQSDPLRVEDEIDRVYMNPPAKLQLHDSHAVPVAIETWGNCDLVVWNPGPVKAREMGDFDNDGYQRMVCIEPANALDNRVTLGPGDSHSLGQKISG